ncbi:MAG: hypothetical protein LBC74_00925, partial [Planctomycetaceae bacterium]|nr:hypothetical protein [Planctomycetaceae bacterium]
MKHIKLFTHKIMSIFTDSITGRFFLAKLYQPVKHTRYMINFTCILFVYFCIGIVPMPYAQNTTPANLPNNPHSANTELLRNTINKVSTWLVRIDTIGGFERVGNEFANEGTSTGILLDKEGYVLTSAFNFLHDPTSILLRFSN